MKSNVPVGFFRHEDFENLRNKARKVLTPMFTELVVSTEEPFIQAIFDGVIPAMAFGRICIMDDAAFAARPHCGAGTVKAAEDAWQLGSTLAERYRVLPQIVLVLVVVLLLDFFGRRKRADCQQRSKPLSLMLNELLYESKI
jgi:2-polyprenyl-6-methoxyphenol hydroxylase-like FAD-dependent oxidoreductase